MYLFSSDLHFTSQLLRKVKSSLKSLLLYNRRGQTEARGPHAAHQRFFAAPVAKFNDEQPYLWT